MPRAFGICIHIFHKRTINTAPTEAQGFLHTFNPALILVTLLSLRPLSRMCNIQVGTHVVFCSQNSKRKKKLKQNLGSVRRGEGKEECEHFINCFNSKVLGLFLMHCFPLCSLRRMLGLLYSFWH